MPNTIRAAAEGLPTIKQPRERVQEHNALVVYSTLPKGCISFPVTDEYSMPFIQPGEWVVVDTTDRTARVGDIFVIQWDSGSRNICQARHSAPMWQRGRETPSWHVGSMKTSSREAFEEWLKEADAERRNGAIPVWQGAWTEGPLELDHLESKLVGAVIGLFQPDFIEPRRTVGESS
jgi:hypothetical protein